MILPQNPTFSGFGCCLSPVSSAKILSSPYLPAMTLAVSFSVRCFHNDRQRCFWRPSQCGSSGGSDMVEEKVGVQTCKWLRQQLQMMWSGCFKDIIGISQILLLQPPLLPAVQMLEAASVPLLLENTAPVAASLPSALSHLQWASNISWYEHQSVLTTG